MRLAGAGVGAVGVRVTPELAGAVGARLIPDGGGLKEADTAGACFGFGS